MAWTAQGSIRGPAGPAADTENFVTSDDVATAASPGKIVRRGTTGQVTVPESPDTSTDAVSKGWVAGHYTLGAFTIVKSPTPPSSPPSNQITIVVPS